MSSSGCVSEFQLVNEVDLKIWDMYKEHLESKIQDQFNIPKSHQLEPVQVAHQLVAGINYFFKVELPDNKYVTATVYHIPWEEETHGSHEHVWVDSKLLDSPDEDIRD